MPKDAPVNVGACDSAPMGSWSRVSEMQAKLHRWAAADPGRRFDDLFNLVHDPATLIVAFDRVAGNRGANTPGVDGLRVTDVEQRTGIPGFLDDLRAQLRAGTFGPLPVRERKIPKPGGSGKVRSLGITTVADRVVQAALKLVLEPIFEADFLPVSYGFRPKRRAHDAIAEIHHLGTAGYRWVLDADIHACFDSISHSALLDRVRAKIKDKRVLALVKAFLKAGVLTELGDRRDTHTGTPQGSILSPLMANIALSVLDEHLHGPWLPGGVMATGNHRVRRKRKGLPNWRVVRYADDFVVLVDGHQSDVQALHETIAKVLQPLGLRLSPAKTQIVHMSEGFDFLVPHPVAPQARNEPVVHLHLHRRPAHPVVEGQDPCPDEQDIAAGPQDRADQNQPDHARVGQLPQARRLQEHPWLPRKLRVPQGDPLVDGATPLEVQKTSAGTSPTTPASGTGPRRTGSNYSTSPRSRSPDTATEATRSPTPGQSPTTPDGTDHGEPVAERLARRVRRATWGNRPGATPTPRPRPTQQPHALIR
jgi:RNA-directed DNA polymerase